MAYGIPYEMAITVFVVLFGILFIVGGYTELARPFIQLAMLFGIVMALVGWSRKDYDLFYGGITFIIMSIVVAYALPSVGVSQGRAEGWILEAIYPILFSLDWVYSIHPLIFVIIVVLFAYAISRK